MKEIVIISFLIILCSCATPHRANGFYEVADYPDDRIIGKPIVTVAEFEKITLNTHDSITLIEGRLTPSATEIFANATEKLIGHRIGFVFCDSVVMAPKINCRIDGGRFQIISPDTALIKRIYTHIMLSNAQN
jgi:hypothetical protein